MVFVCVSTIVQVLFDHNGCMKKYNTVTEILQEFYEVWRDMQRPMSSLHLCLFISLCVLCVAGSTGCLPQEKGILGGYANC